MAQKITFSFGKNWQSFLSTINPLKLDIAKKSIQDFMDLKTLKGKSVVDIGSGSGIFSYSVYNLNADNILSIDVDPFSVKCSEYMHDKAGKPDNWLCCQDSILEDNLHIKYGTFDVVYSWGVLHHTGDMNRAIINAGKMVASNGMFYIALYNNVTGVFGSKFWLKVKTLYNKYPLLGKYVMEPYYMFSFFVISLLKGRNPIKLISEYKNKRGMNWRRDVTDWFGGYPYEYGSVEEIFNLMKVNFPSFRLVNVKSTNGLGNNWFLFQNIK